MALGGRFRGKRSAIVLVHSDGCLCPCGGVWIGDGYWGGGGVWGWRGANVLCSTCFLADVEASCDRPIHWISEPPILSVYERTLGGEL